MLALSCDARVMVDKSKFHMGLNEAAFGLAPPPWLAQLVTDAVGRRQSERLLQRGLLLPPEEARLLGLVDQTVPLARLADEAHAQLTELLAVPDGARVAVKQMLRQEAADKLRDTLSEDLDAFVTMAASPSVQTRIRAHLESTREAE
jgi:enoyl-CoA hydratase/carnithine racemase